MPYCTVLSYPTIDIDANLAMIRDLQLRFPENIIGYSDHTLPNDMKVLELATLIGATILEKHFTHDKTSKEMIIIIQWIKRILTYLCKG